MSFPHASPPMPLLRLQLSLPPPPSLKSTTTRCPIPFAFKKCPTQSLLLTCMQLSSIPSRHGYKSICFSFPCALPHFNCLIEFSFYFITHSAFAVDSRSQSAHSSYHGLRRRASTTGVPGGSSPCVIHHQSTLGYRQAVRRSPYLTASSTCLFHSSASTLVGRGIVACG